MEAIGEHLEEAYDAGARLLRSARLHAVPGAPNVPGAPDVPEIPGVPEVPAEHPAVANRCGLAAPASLEGLGAQPAATALNAPNALATPASLQGLTAQQLAATALNAPNALAAPASLEGLTAQQLAAAALDAPTGPATPACLEGLSAQLAVAALNAPIMLAGADYLQAAEFAARVEELSRSAERLQILAAGAVDRTRTQAITDAAAAKAREARGRNRMGRWDANGVETLDDDHFVNETDASWPTGPNRPAVTSPADDGCRNTAEFLRIRLRIPIREARRRLALAHQTLPGLTLTGEATPPPCEHLAAALAPTPEQSAPVNDADGAGTAGDGTHGDGTAGDGAAESSIADGHVARVLAPAVSTYAATIITATLARLQHRTSPEMLDRIEQHLTTEATTNDPDFLCRLAQRWTDTIDADGAEPSEEALRHTQGAFIRKPRYGLHRVEILATTDQYEYLLTVMNTATNPRTTVSGSTGNLDPVTGKASTNLTGTVTGTGTGMGATYATSGMAQANSAAVSEPGAINLDRRTRPQKQLDGIVTAVKAALATNTLPTTGGNRPQIIATINCLDLFPDAPVGAIGLADAFPVESSGNGPGLRTGPQPGPETGSKTGTATGTEPRTRTGPGTEVSTGTATSTGAFVFTGPVAATTLRKIACDADIIPALLGTNSEILDLGRKARLFTPAQRNAITARDQGCAFPTCTIPAPWCEVHHITYWSRGGETSVNNGILLCSHHHHLVHKEQWTINTASGTPWFVPPPHIDPRQKPQQNHFFKPPPPPVRRE